MAVAKGSGLDSEGGVVKKPRTVFTPKQLLHLEEEFAKNQFPSMEQRKQIAKDLDLTQQHIQVSLSSSFNNHVLSILSCTYEKIFLLYTYIFRSYVAVTTDNYQQVCYVRANVYC